jgi:ribosomal protein S18 acetylase RimI-like enzyme
VNQPSLPAAVTIRVAVRADLPVLGQLGALLIRTHHAFDSLRFMAPGADPAPGYARFLATQLGESEVVIFVAERAGEAGGSSKVVGYVYAGLEPMSWQELREPAGFIHDLVVEPAARGMGVARHLVERAADWLEAHGAPRVMLWTAQRNAGARALFEQLGFRTTMLEMTREKR